MLYVQWIGSYCQVLRPKRIYMYTLMQEMSIVWTLITLLFWYIQYLHEFRNFYCYTFHKYFCKISKRFVRKYQATLTCRKGLRCILAAQNVRTSVAVNVVWRTASSSFMHRINWQFWQMLSNIRLLYCQIYQISCKLKKFWMFKLS